MGCKGSKDGKEERAIDSEFQQIGIARFDDFFNDAHTLLDSAETIRSGIEDSKERGAEIAETWQLKESKYIDTVQVLFWAASAENGGQIKKTDLEVMGEPPFVKMNGSKITHDTYNLYDTFSTYLKTVAEGPGKLKEIVDSLQAMAEKAPDLVKEGKNEVQNSSLDLRGKATAIARLGKNSAKLPKELAKCKALQEVLTTAKDDMKELVPKLKELYSKADEVGAKAAGENLIRPREIFQKYHPGPKKTPKEIEDERKAQEKGQAKDKGKGKDDKGKGKETKPTAAAGGK